MKWKIAQHFELNWWRKYLKNKNPDDYLEWKKKYWLDVLSKISSLSFEDNAMVLDCGCGPAGIFMVLPNNVFIDAEDPLLNKYEAEFSHFKKSMYPTVNFYPVSLENFSTEKKYDFVFCMNAINHVKELDNCYDKLVSLLKPNGKLIISIDAHNYSFFKHLFRLLPALDVLHPHQFNLKEYEKILTIRGLKTIQTELLKKEFFFNHYLQVAQLN